MSVQVVIQSHCCLRASLVSGFTKQEAETSQRRIYWHFHLNINVILPQMPLKCLKFFQTLQQEEQDRDKANVVFCFCAEYTVNELNKRQDIILVDMSSYILVG